MRVFTPRKILVASAGVAAVSYALFSRSQQETPIPVGNLVPPPPPPPSRDPTALAATWGNRATECSEDAECVPSNYLDGSCEFQCVPPVAYSKAFAEALAAERTRVGCLNATPECGRRVPPVTTTVEAFCKEGRCARRVFRPK
jgi:hypothetical protein